nr:hypothetical protein [Agrobacterium larrymoorei]
MATVAGVIVVAAVGAYGAKVFYEKKINEVFARSVAAAGSIGVDFLGNVHIRDLTVPVDGGKQIRVATIDGRPKLAFLDGTLEMSGVDIDMPTGDISIPQLRIENAAFHDLAKPAPVADGQQSQLSSSIKNFAAERIFTPEMTIVHSIAQTSQKIVYKNVALANVAGGQIANYSADGANQDIQINLPDSTGSIKERTMVVSTGAIAGKDFDAALLVRLYTDKAGPEDTEPRPLYGPLSVSKISFSDGNGKFSFDEIRSDGFSVRMPAVPLLETLNALSAVKNTDQLSPKDSQALITQTLAIFDMIGKSNMQLLGFKADAPDGTDSSGAKRITANIERMEMQMDRRKVDFGVYGISIANGDDRIDVAEASLDGFDWGATMDTLSELVALDEAQIATFPFNKMIPELGRLRVGGINVDVAPPENPDTETDGVAERVKFTLRNFEMGLTKPFNGIPTDIEIRQDDLSLPVPETSSEEMFVEARKLGLENITLSYAMSAGWDQANDNLNIREISLSSKGFGSVNLTGLISGFTEEFFAFDVNRAQAALFGLAGREVKLTITDEGLMDKAIRIYAAENNMTEDQVRGTLTFAASMVLQQVAAAQPKLQEAVNAVGSFINTPGVLTVSVKSTGQNGLGVFDLVAASQDPMLLLDKVDIQAVAE